MCLCLLWFRCVFILLFVAMCCLVSYVFVYLLCMIFFYYLYIYRERDMCYLLLLLFYYVGYHCFQLCSSFPWLLLFVCRIINIIINVIIMFSLLLCVY